MAKKIKNVVINVLGIDNATKKIEFEKEVKVDGNTKFIDVYISETNTLIEQKSMQELFIPIVL